jgi:hypothetical protein
MAVAAGKAERANAPRRSNLVSRVLALAVAVVLTLAVFVAGVRPWYLQWGATDDEARAPLSGDEIIPNADRQETRAITIRASVDRVWPWLAQLGQDRGGFYSYDILENLVGCAMPTEDVLRPDKQSWQLGDKLWMYPSDKAGGIGFATLRSYVPGRSLGFGTRMTGRPLSEPEDGSWSFVLVPLGDSATRFLVRGRGAPGRSLLGVAFDRSFFEPVHFLMERRMMIGIAQLAEGSNRHRLANHVAVALWTVTFAILVAAAVMVLRRRRWGLPVAAFLAAAVVFQVLTLRQPSLTTGVVLVFALVLFSWEAWRPDRQMVATSEG